MCSRGSLTRLYWLIDVSVCFFCLIYSVSDSVHLIGLFCYYNIFEHTYERYVWAIHMSDTYERYVWAIRVSDTCERYVWTIRMNDGWYHRWVKEIFSVSPVIDFIFFVEMFYHRSIVFYCLACYLSFCSESLWSRFYCLSATCRFVLSIRNSFGQVEVRCATISTATRL